MQAMRLSITKAVSDRTLIIHHDTDPFHQEMYVDDLNIEFEKLVSTESIDSAQAATATSHKAWRKPLSDWFSFNKARKMEYYNQGEPRKSDHHTT